MACWGMCRWRQRIRENGVFRTRAASGIELLGGGSGSWRGGGVDSRSQIPSSWSISIKEAMSTSRGEAGRNRSVKSVGNKSDGV